ncbi:MAG: hypothetical protein JO110_02325 [Acetobacteraceae bacterium]|nr:hypothetical protein [Acetobacteraceae bacterium]
MRKLVLASLAALAIGTAAFAQPADAACRRNGFAWHCWPHHHVWYHHPWHSGWHGPHWWHHHYAYYR